MVANPENRDEPETRITGDPAPAQDRTSQRGLAAFPIDRVIAGKYRLIKALKRGGMGVVCEAIHEGTGKRVAVKLLSRREIAHVSGLPDDDSFVDRHAEMVTRFHREARAAGTVDSRHIVQVFDTGTDPESGEPYMVMELLAGRDLREVMRALKVVHPDAALRIAAQACLGLHLAHEAGIVHRDIKPGNLFLVESDGPTEVKVLDFGIAKMRHPSGDGESTDLTRTGSIVGSPVYMSPEQIQGLKTIDRRADIWSMGVVLFRALSGRTPHVEESTGRLLVLICTEEAPPLRSVAPWVEPRVASIVDRALQLEPEDRFATALEMREALIAALGEDPRIGDTTIRAVPEADRVPIPDAPHRDDHSTVITSVGDPRRPAAASSESNKRLWAWGAAAIAVGGLAAWISVAPSSGTHAEAEPAASSSPSDAAVETVFVTVPANARVRVDGAPTEIDDGRVAITKKLGSRVVVEIEDGDRRQTTTIAITESGALPDSVRFALATSSSEQPATTSSGTAPTAGSPTEPVPQRHGTNQPHPIPQPAQPQPAARPPTSPQPTPASPKPAPPTPAPPKPAPAKPSPGALGPMETLD